MIKLLRKVGFVPRVAVWELTLRCNLNCRHCGSRAGKPRQDELTLDEALKLCKELGELKCRFLTMGGGEPLLRRDWPLIAQCLIENGVQVGMVTNGLAWTPEVASTVKMIGLESVAFSVDGFEEEHDYLRRSPGLFRKVMEAIDSALAAGIHTSVVTTITRANLGRLKEFRAMLGERGVERWQVQLGTATGNLADHRELVIHPEDVLTLVPLIAEMCKDRQTPRVYPGHDIGYFGEPEQDLRDPKAVIPFWTGCSAGCSVIGIESNGNIKGCLSLPSSMEKVDAFVEGNVRRSSLREIWTRRGAFAYNREFTVGNLGGFCRTCEYAEVCRGGCTWINFAQNDKGRDNAFCYWRQKKLAEQRSELASAPSEVRAQPGV